VSADPTPRLAVACLVLALAALIPAASLSLRSPELRDLPFRSPAPRVRGARDMDEVLARRIEARSPREPGAWPAWVMHRRPLEVPTDHPLAPR